MGKKYLILLFLLASKFSLAEDVETICVEIDEGGTESVNGFCISQELLRESSVTIHYGDDYWAWNQCETILHFNLEPMLNGS
ncbi:hypothetical protein [Shewanella sp. KCT]|uniref:hypothetical protein n=1 Tax=Shewanella sp. KCT TaxID=2569535 RepID=UPI0011838B32|nr:hypothetical protein [Shewanella sp. KCT]TVP13227.1 hypothetical protein AYI87_12695 [Shewanella sp. KCT]